MPWLERNTMSLRGEFVQLARLQRFSFAELCRRFGISRKTGYKWCRRHSTTANLGDQSRRPTHSPRRTATEIEGRVVDLRQQHPAWGARKLRKVLQTRGVNAVPATSTITDILRRHGLIAPEEALKHSAWQRFERAEPNELWQMDFKGYFATDAGNCHPLTIVDDHSRYAVGLFACGDERTQTVRERLTNVFRRYGLPRALLTDNGPPWGSAGADESHTALTVWLLQVGVPVLHGRPYHPQTQGKDERFHRTLKTEVLHTRFGGLAQCQQRFDGWRHEYNWVRPHQALALEVPGSRYQPSRRAYPEKLPAAEFAPGQEVRKVEANGIIRLWGRRWKVGRAFAGLNVAIEPSLEDGKYAVRFNGLKVKTLDRRAGE